VRERIESLLAAWARLAYRRARLVILLVVAAVAGLSSQLPRIEFDTSTESFLHADDPLRVTYDAFRDQFGRDDLVVIAIETDDIFEPAFLEKLRAFHEELESGVPNLEEVRSLVNARNTRGEGDELVVGDLLEDWPETPEQLAEIRRIALANPLYRDQLISRDGRFTTVLIETNAYSALGGEVDALAGFDETEASAEPAPGERRFLTGEENAAIVAAVEAIVRRYDAPDFRVFASGTPVMVESLHRAMQTDMARFTMLAVLTIAVFLALLFRRPAGVALPLATVGLSLVSTLSVMAITGYAITVPTQILPSFLLAVGVGYSVHVLVIFFQRRRMGEDKEDAIAFALEHSGLAIVMTCLTTAGGLVSFAAAEIAPIADFGVFAPVGVVMALLFTFLLLPAFMAVLPMRQKSDPAGRAKLVFSQRMLVRTGDFATAHAPAVSLVSAGLLCVALLGVSLLRFSHNPITWFPEDDPFRRSVAILNDELRGGIFMELLVDTGRENGLQDPEVLKRMEEVRSYASGMQLRDIYVGKTIGLQDVVKETHQALHENRPEYYAIPDDPLLVAQELLLFENSGSDDLEDLVDSRFSKGRMTMKMPFVDAVQYRDFIETANARFSEILGDDVELTLTGLMVVMGRTISAVIGTMARAYAIALAIITPLLVLLIGRVRIGLVAMIPNLTPIILTLGLMGWAGIPIDAFTLLIGSIAIGLAVDDTIHFMHNFRRYFEASGDVRRAVHETMTSTGQALLYTSLVLSAGFFIYTFATMNNLFYFGLLTGLTIILAFLADVILAPALLVLVARPAKSAARGRRGEIEGIERMEEIEEMEVTT
jgi:predicted RND superfamily exporter protein